MTDTRELDQKIVEAAEGLAAVYGQHGPWQTEHVNRVLAAVAAKREAETPKHLTAEEASEIWRATYDAGWKPGAFAAQVHVGSYQAVLTTCLERAALVVDRALAEYATRPWEGTNTYTASRGIVRRALLQKE